MNNHFFKENAMTIKVSLLEEPTNIVKDRADSDLSSNVSEVISDYLNSTEVEHIRKVVAPRLKALHQGTAKIHDFDAACEEINQEVFG